MLRLVRQLILILVLYGSWAAPASAAKRVALVIGNSAYQHATPLANPKNDAEAISKGLSELGFEVVKGINLTHADFATVVSQFRAKLKGADVGLFFYAGHGLQVQGENFLAPIDSELKDETSLDFETVRLSTVLSLMERETKTNLVFLDACRDNPLARSLARSMGTRSAAIGRGLARVESGLGTLIAFATQPGNVALDGAGENSPFTQALLKHIGTPGLEVEALMRRVRVDVMNTTADRQVPWNNSSLTGAFMFNDKAPVANLDLKAVELALWQAANSGHTKSLYAAYLLKFPKGSYTYEAKAKIDAFEKEEASQRAREQEARSLAEKVRQQAETERRAKAEAERQKLRAERDQLAKEREEFAQRLKSLEAQTEIEAKKAGADRQKDIEEQAARESEMAAVRDAYQVKLKALEAQAQTLAAQIQSNAEERKLAALTAPSGTPAAKAEMDVGEMTMVLQSELKRVGCDPGVLDGDWGQQARAALAQFNAYAKLNLPISTPTMEAIGYVREQRTRVCPEETERASLPKSQAPGQAQKRVGPPGGTCKDGNMAHCRLRCSQGVQPACARLARGQ